mgnify:CR=1 FL=1
MRWDLLSLFLVNGLIVGVLYGLVAMCFVLIYKASRVVNFAQGELMLIGAWVCWSALAQYGLSFPVAFLFTVAFSALLGVAIQLVVLRPLIGEPLISMIMVTVGLSVFFQAVLKWIFGVAPQSFPPVLSVQKISFLGMEVEAAYLASSGAAIVLLAGFAYFFKVSKLGLAMRATAFNQQVAQSLGVSVRHVFALAWAISAFVSAMAGIVIALVNGVSAGLSAFGIKVFPAVILGGLDSIVGAVIGGIVIGVLENVAEYVDGQYLHWGNLYTIAPFYVLVIILMIKPYGLFGSRDIERL